MNEGRFIASTQTGGFGIGFRRLSTSWLTDLSIAIRFALDNGFAAIDVAALELSELKTISDAGLSIGTVDLPSPWSELICEDPKQRSAVAGRFADYARRVREYAGVLNFFSVAIPRDAALPRRDNFAYAVDGFGQIARALEPTGARVVLEGWPGPPPHFPSLGCSPADCRALLRAIDSPAIGINYDPSHLLRMNIDPVRFIDEFGPRIFHAHAKDTVIHDHERYEHGTLQPPTFAEFRRWSGPGWRYAVPGRGNLPWKCILQKLYATGYRGVVSIELEDEDFNGTEAGEKLGLTEARDFLMSM